MLIQLFYIPVRYPHVLHSQTFISISKSRLQVFTRHKSVT